MLAPLNQLVELYLYPAQEVQLVRHVFGFLLRTLHHLLYSLVEALYLINAGLLFQKEEYIEGLCPVHALSVVIVQLKRHVFVLAHATLSLCALEASRGSLWFARLALLEVLLLLLKSLDRFFLLLDALFEFFNLRLGCLDLCLALLLDSLERLLRIFEVLDLEEVVFLDAEEMVDDGFV